MAQKVFRKSHVGNGCRAFASFCTIFDVVANRPRIIQGHSQIGPNPTQCTKLSSINEIKKKIRFQIPVHYWICSAFNINTDLRASVKHGPQDLRRHDHAGSVGIDGYVSRHQADVLELILEQRDVWDYISKTQIAIEPRKGQ